MARRDEGAYSPEICNRGATQPAIPPRRKTARGIFKTGSEALPSKCFRLERSKKCEFEILAGLISKQIPSRSLEKVLIPPIVPIPRLLN
jgi:hypothetical protein